MTANGFRKREVTDSSLVHFSGNMAVFSSVPGGATAHGLRLMVAARVLPQEQGQGSLQEACRKLALQRVLLLWRTRLSQRQQAK